MTVPPQISQRPTPSALRDGSLLFFVALAFVSAAGVLAIKGPDALQRAVGSGLWLLVTIAPLIALGLFLGGLTRELADPAKVAPVLGARSGWWGLGLATVLGALTPGGPFAAFPIVYALFLAGADIGAVIAFLTGWSVLALHRVVVWEIPLLGPEFAFVRTVASLPLPILAGAAARRLAVGWLRVEAPMRAPPPQGRP